jgi:ABC-type uncharacterized transport system ATPase subunit
MIEASKNEDGTYTVVYCNKEIGHISKVMYLPTRRRAYRGITVHGDIRYAGSLAACKRAVVEASKF